MGNTFSLNSKFYISTVGKKKNFLNAIFYSILFCENNSLKLLSMIEYQKPEFFNSAITLPINSAKQNTFNFVL